jgi:phosphohistidine phosphatase
MDLYILRHGIAEELSESNQTRDSQRRLTSEGRKKVHRVAQGMKALALKFDLVLSSPYLRASETAEIVAKELRLTRRLKWSSDLVSDGNSKKLIDDLRLHHRQARRILLVGHEPNLSRLISLLISGDPTISIHLKKAGLIKLTIASALKCGRCATLEWFLMPAQLKKLA